jgi:transcriptional regulator with XRE-family HTH domain
MAIKRRRKQRPTNAELSRRKGVEHPLRRIFRTNLRNRRLSLGIQQRELADRVGTVQQWIQQLEDPKGDEAPNFYLLFDLAAELGCTASDLLTAGKFLGVAGPDEDLRAHGRLSRLSRE